MVESTGQSAQAGTRLHFNLLLIGDQAVGKTSIMKRYVSKKFDQVKAATSGVDFCTTKYKSEEGEDCRVKIWDTAGQERFRQLTTSFFKDADGVIVTFDLTNHETFLNVRDWIASVFKYKDRSIPLVLVGNKLDLCDPDSADNARQVETESAQELATSYNMAYFETSAKADLNVGDLMQHIFKITYNYKKKNTVTEPEDKKSFTLEKARHSEVGNQKQKAEKQKKGGCCK